MSANISTHLWTACRQMIFCRQSVDKQMYTRVNPLSYQGIYPFSVFSAILIKSFYNDRMSFVYVRMCFRIPAGEKSHER